MENKKVLKKLLADTYVLYLKLQNFHWKREYQILPLFF